MSSKNGTGQVSGTGKAGATNGGAAGALAVSDPTAVRNVVLVGHSGAGKTTLAEALLAATGTISRAGKVTDGTTVCDFDAAAVKQQRSVALTVAPVHHQGIKINIFDTPGYADFTGELRAGLRAADAALFIVSAADEIDASTIGLWAECAAVGMPRAVVVTRLDHPRARFADTVSACRNAFGDNVMPLYLPLDPPAGETAPTALLGLLTQQVYDHADSQIVPRLSAPAEDLLEDAAAARAELIEGIIAESEDETLMDRYLGGETLDPEALITDLETATERGGFHPVLPVSALTGTGLVELLDGIVSACPSPAQRTTPPVTNLDGSRHPGLLPDPTGPLVAEVVRTSADPYVGRVSLVRVFSGTLRPDGQVHIAGHWLAERGHEDHDEDERVTHIQSPLGANLREIPYCVAGDVCALTKLTSAETGDTLSDPNHPLLIKPWEMPRPLLPVAVVAKTRGDEDSMAKNLGKLVASDPTLWLERNAETHQLVLWCMGESHADVVLDRLRAGGAELDTEPVKVSFRETFSGPAKARGRHVKQSGGHGQYAICEIEVEPLPTGSGFEFRDKVVGGAVPHQFIPSVEKGVRTQMERGLAGGAPVVDIRVTLVDGKAHSVDSSDAAFQMAGALALKEAAAAAGVSILEPVDEVAVTVPDTHVGAIMGDLSSRRGRVQGTEPATDRGEHTVVRAEVPAAELTRYTVDLRSLTSGTANFTRKFARYEPIPTHLADKATAAG